MASTKASTDTPAIGEVANTVVDETASVGIERYFTIPERDPFEEVEWELRDAFIPGKDKAVFDQKGVEFPKFWSQTATNIVAQKYFRGRLGSPEREWSVKQMIGRVVDTIGGWGRAGGYFASDDEADTFESELKAILVNQYASFNSPVWFNVGFEERPQCSACQPYTALVSTPEGMVQIGELVDGDQVGREVYDAHGVTRIVAVKHNGRKPVYRVTLRNGQYVEATPDHVVKAVHDRRTEPAWLRVDELKPGMRMHLHPHRAKVADRVCVPAGGPTVEDDLSEATDEQIVATAEAALAGWLQANGFVGQYDRGTNRSLTIEFQVATEEEYGWVSHNLEIAFPDAHRHVSEVRREDGSVSCRRIRLYGEALRDFVEEWELLRRGTDIRVPARLWTGTHDEITAYLRSIFQADGYVTVRRGRHEQGRIGFAVVGEQWTEDVQLLLNVLGIYSRRSHKRERRSDRQDTHEVAISIGSERARFAELVGFVSHEEQERLLDSLMLRDPKRCPDLLEEEIVSIDFVGVDDVYDIQTESGEYLTNNVAVHNCFILSIDDSMESILDWIRREGIIFRGGSGSGVNLSKLRSSKEQLSKGGYASGPVSFMRGADASAGTIKSGGKCFRQGTLVATPEGWRPIEQLRIGENVLTHEGPRAVADFMPNGRKQCYRVLTREGYEVEVTEGHKFAYWNEVGGGFDVKPIEAFDPGDALFALLHPSEGGTTIPLLSPEIADPAHATTTVEMQLPTELNERLAYVVGLAYGDGELRATYPYRLRVAFCKDEAGELSAERFSEYCRDLFGEEPSPLGDERGHRQLGFTRKRLVEFLVANGLAKGKGDELGFPAMLFGAEPAVRAAFIAGVIDADGTYQRRGGWSISSTDRPFLADLQRLLLTLGVPSKIKLSREQRGTWRPLYRLCVVGHTFVDRLARLIAPHSAKAEILYEPSAGADKGWGYRPSLYGPLTARVGQRGGYRLVERSVGTNETSGYRAVATLATHPDAAVADYAQEVSTCVQLTLESVTPTEVAETYDIEVEDVHLLSANGIYSSNTRRAAKMVVLDVDHPDIEEFIWCKAHEEEKARVLEAAGYDMSLDSPDWASIQYQNANNSVRVTDAFMEAATEGREWNLTARTDGTVIETKDARELLRQIAEAAWKCADPGVQYDTTINAWHTCPNSGRINASNPCSEYMHLDDSACNLASLNLMKFRREDGELDVEAFQHAVDVVFLAQEIVVGYSSYPTPEIEANAKAYRELGLGYANLGALLMARGLPYDSDEGRAYAAAITALMTGRAYRKSAEVARRMGPFAGYRPNAAAMLGVIAKHRAAVGNIQHADSVPADLLGAARTAWDDALNLGEVNGFRNSQSSVIAPTGTISFMMDCDTTGIEPDFSLVKSKKLVGGGEITIVNKTVPMALDELGYAPGEIEEIVAYIDERNSIVGAPYVKAEHYPVFDCAIGDRAIHYSGHVKMMGAVQPFISGAISKCVAGETLVPTTKGLIRIGSLYGGEAEDSFRDMHLPLASLDGLRETDAFYYGGARQTLEVVLRSGHRLVGTPNHRVLVAASEGGLVWRRLDEIEPGDQVATQYGDDLWSPYPVRFTDFEPSTAYGSQKAVTIPEEMTEDLAFFLGAFAAEGHVTRSTHTARIANADEQVIARLVELGTRLFGIRPRVARSDGKCPSIELSSKTLVEFLDYLGCGDRARDKRIPDAVLRSPRAMVLAFLEGLSLDSYLPASVPKWAICLASRSLLDDLQAVLTNLGIVHSRIAKYNAEYDRSFEEVYVSGRHAQRLVSLLRFPERHKAARAAELTGTDVGISTADVVPGIAGRDLYELIPAGRSGRSGKGSGRSKQFRHLVDPRSAHVSWGSLQQVATLPGVELPDWLETVLERNLHFSPVVEIADGGEREVFDVSVPETHAFVANGIVSHNTVNLPEQATVDEVAQLIADAWRLGVKAIAIYRDNCKVAQPLAGKKEAGTLLPPTPLTQRRRLPEDRTEIGRKFRVGDYEGYIHVGLYEDGTPGDIFVDIAKDGTTMAGLMNSLMIAVSMGLQYGVPPEVYVSKLSHMRFEPSGLTNDADIRSAKSIVDYIFRWFGKKFLTADQQEEAGILSPEVKARLAERYAGGGDAEPAAAAVELPPAGQTALFNQWEDAVECARCGGRMVRTGSCYTCRDCGTNTGCS